MLRPITLEDYKQYRERYWKETSLISYILAYSALSFMAKKPLFLFGLDWRLFGLLFICQVLAFAVVMNLEFLIALWLGRLNLAIPRYALDERHAHPKAITILMMSFWQNERILQIFSVVATVTGVVWSYRSLAPLVESL
jgi:hypothetical protein